MSHDPENRSKIWRKTDLLWQKWQEFGEIWSEHSKVSKTCTFICSYCANYLIFDLKKYGGAIFHDTEERCKILRKTDFWFEKWHEEYGEFSPEHLKVSKFGLWWDAWIQSRRTMNYLQRSHVSWQWRMMQNLNRNWLVTSKLTWRIRQILTWALESLKKFSLIRLLLNKVYIFLAKKVQGSYLSWHWKGIQKLERKRLVIWKLTWGIW